MRAVSGIVSLGMGAKEQHCDKLDVESKECVRRDLRLLRLENQTPCE